MPFWAAALPVIKGVGAAIGAAGGLKSLFSSSSSPGTSTEPAKDQAYRTYLTNKKSIQAQLEMAGRSREEYGIHPLAALGLNPAITGAGVVSPGQKRDKGEILSELGQNLTRAASAMQTVEEKDVMRAQAEMLRAQAKYYNSNSPSNRKGEPPTPGIPDGSTDKRSIEGQADMVKTVPVEVKASKGLGYQSGSKPLIETTIGPDGSIIEHPNAELMEAAENDWMLKRRLDYLNIKATGKAQLAHYTRHPKLMEWMKNKQKVLNQDVKAQFGKNYEARWDINEWVWKIVKKDGNKSSLFVHGKPFYLGKRKFSEKERQIHQYR